MTLLKNLHLPMLTWQHMINDIETLHPTPINSFRQAGHRAVIVEDVEEGAAEVPRSQGIEEQYQRFSH